VSFLIHIELPEKWLFQADPLFVWKPKARNIKYNNQNNERAKYPNDSPGPYIEQMGAAGKHILRNWSLEAEAQKENGGRFTSRSPLDEQQSDTHHCRNRTKDKKPDGGVRKAAGNCLVNLLAQRLRRLIAEIEQDAADHKKCDTYNLIAAHSNTSYFSNHLHPQFLKTLTTP
jgi:hypothetical protein